MRRSREGTGTGNRPARFFGWLVGCTNLREHRGEFAVLMLCVVVLLSLPYRYFLFIFIFGVVVVWLVGSKRPGERRHVEH